MGTNNLDNHPSLTRLTVRSVALVFLILFCSAMATESAAVEFRFLAEGFDSELDDRLALTADSADDQARHVDQDASDDDSEADDSEEDESEDEIDRAIAAVPVPEVVDGRFRLPPLGVRTIATQQIGNGRVPESFWEGKQGNLQPFPESGNDRGAQWSGAQWNWSVMNWSAANTFSYPLYFEDRMLERHGHVRFGFSQPAAAGARFFATVPMLPYLMTISDPCECEYKLGHYRTGSCAPVVIQRPPLERRAVVAEVLTLGGIIAIFP